MRFGDLLTAAAIQLVVLLLPLAAGIIGLISGGLAGLLAVVGWFVIGVPVSYLAIDALAARRPSLEARARVRSVLLESELSKS